MRPGHQFRESIHQRAIRDDPRYVVDMFQSREPANSSRFSGREECPDIHPNIINFSTFHKAMSLGVVLAC